MGPGLSNCIAIATGMATAVVIPSPTTAPTMSSRRLARLVTDGCTTGTGLA